jgi:hypothetical protein
MDPVPDVVRPPYTRTYLLTLATDGDVSADEIERSLDALGYHVEGVSTFAFDHEHPCPTMDGCITSLRRDGFDIPDGTDCCICWLSNHHPAGKRA